MSQHYSLGLLCCLLVLTLCPVFALAQCSVTNPCKTGCCSRWGNCGFGPDFCSPANCVGTCGAVAECGQYAPEGSRTCPLNVCCSQWGFCGTTSDFCGTGCQNGCVSPPNPGCIFQSYTSDMRTIGYYESWSSKRTCDAFFPEDIRVEYLTHINFAFALVGSDFKIAAMNAYDVDLYSRVFIAVGGWSAGGAVFSSMASSAANRAVFIQSVVAFMETYAFDGIDIDWEYPSAVDRGGVPSDKANYVSLLREVRLVFGNRYGISTAIPASFWYLQGFDVAGMQPYVDWFNLMSYDIHGTWDGDSEWTQPLVLPHTNISEISDGLRLLWRNNVNPRKVVLGLAFYGRSFTLENPACNTPGCRFKGGGEKGECTGESGILSNAEIQRRITTRNLTPVLDVAAAVKYVSWDTNQWISYDDGETFVLKRRFANGNCLGGTMIWAVDLDEKNSASSLTGLAKSNARFRVGPDRPDTPPELDPFAAAGRWAIEGSNNAALVTFWTSCEYLYTIPRGFRVLTSAHGKIYDAQQRTEIDQCYSNNGGQRRLLIEDDVIADGCFWIGVPKQCDARCPQGTYLVAMNSGPPQYAQKCNPGTYASFCCRKFSNRQGRQGPGVCPVNPMALAFSGGLAPVDDILGAIQHRNAVFSKYGAVDIVGTPTECAFINGDLASTFTALGVIAFALVGMWINDVITGYPMFRPANQSPRSIAQQSSPCIVTKIEKTSTTSIRPPRETSLCDGNWWGQACYHYSSVARQRQYNPLTCPFTPPSGGRQAPRRWDGQHDKEWSSWIVRGDCQRDEYPFFRFMGPPNFYFQIIRLLPRPWNAGAGSIANGYCPIVPLSEVTTSLGPATQGTCTEYRRTTTLVDQLAIRFTNLPAPDDGLALNPCLPTILVNDPGYALYTDDPWYQPVGGPRPQPYYALPPSAALTAGKVRPRRLEPFLGDPDLVVLDEGNSSRLADPDDLWEHFGVAKCASENCKDEKEALGLDEHERVTVRSNHANPTLAPVILDLKEDGPLQTDDPTTLQRSTRIARPTDSQDAPSPRQTGVDKARITPSL